MTPVLPTTAGDLPLGECRLTAGGRAWAILHAEAVVTRGDEARFLADRDERKPYGVALWPAAIALAHELASRAADLAGRRVLELGAGTGLPGIVAATLGAHVVQTDRDDAALALGRSNAERNGALSIEHRVADWTSWTDGERYDLILGADVIYAPRNHPPLRAIFDGNLAPAGRLLLTDPFRPASLAVLEVMERDGWRVSATKWVIGGRWGKRAVAGYECEKGN